MKCKHWTHHLQEVLAFPNATVPVPYVDVLWSDLPMYRNKASEAKDASLSTVCGAIHPIRSSSSLAGSSTSGEEEIEIDALQLDTGNVADDVDQEDEDAEPEQQPDGNLPELEDMLASQSRISLSPSVADSNAVVLQHVAAVEPTLSPLPPATNPVEAAVQNPEAVALESIALESVVGSEATVPAAVVESEALALAEVASAPVGSAEAASAEVALAEVAPAGVTPAVLAPTVVVGSEVVAP